MTFLRNTAIACCGAAAAAVVAVPDTRVVGGRPVTWADYPAVVALDYIGAPSCTGTRLSAEWVLTAAHCVEGKPTYALSVRDFTGQRVGVEAIRQHPDYQTGSYVNDIALIGLASPLPGPAAVLATGEPDAGADVAILGFGRTAAAGGPSPTLQRGAQHVVSRRACSSALNGLAVDQGRICAGTGDDASGCPGDSGGPAIDRTGQQIGVTSLVATGCPQGKPTVYTAVAPYRAWIERTVWGAATRSGWYVSDRYPGEGWVVQYTGDTAFLAWLGYGGSGPTWAVVPMRRTASGTFEGPVSVCPAGPQSCEGRANITMTPTADGMTVGGVQMQPFLF